MIRRATEADAPALLELIREFYEIDGHVFDRSTATSGLTPLLVSDRYGVVLLEDQGPLGYAAVVWSYSIESGGPDALLDEIFVRERGKGTGRELMHGVFDEMRARGMRRIFLETELHNRQAREFYEGLGFEQEDSVWMVADIGLRR